MLLAKMDTDKRGKTSIVYDQYMFHYFTEDHITFLCMSNASQVSLASHSHPPTNDHTVCVSRMGSSK